MKLSITNEKNVRQDPCAALLFPEQRMLFQALIGKKGYMEEQNYKSFDELPMYMSVPVVAKLFGISESSGYELVHEKGFPAFKIGSRIIVERDKLKEWIDRRSAEGVVS